MSNSQELINEAVTDAAERLEGYDSPEEVDALDVKVVASLDGDVREIHLILTTGGPHIELNATNCTVAGSWGGSTHNTHVNNEDLCNRLHDRYAEIFRARE
jgi:hypothetical protein